MAKKINIRPTTSVYATYKNISYKPWSAIGEFVDNSTQSYYDNKKRLLNTKYWDKLRVEIQYISDDPDYNECIVIKDNAYGMNYNDFQRAIILDSPPINKTRSEFGMGLKTSACWFGKKWSVETVELGSGIKYKTTVDVENLRKYKYEEIEVEESNCSNKEHGTIIRIWDLNRQIKGRSVGKTKSQLAGIYRADIRSGEIEIIYNDEKLNYVEPEILTERMADGSETVWKQDLNFSIKTENKDYNVNGFIGIREKGSTSEAGLTLLRNGRAIVGGYENNYRPEEIFGKSNSFAYQRLFGEINLDNWPVTQTKDQFDWYGGLEDELIQEIKSRILPYIDKANKFRKQSSLNVNDSFEIAVKNLNDAKIIENVELEPQLLNNIELIDNKDITNQDKTNIIENSSNYKLKFNYNHSNYTINFSANLEENNTKDWLTIIADDKEQNSYRVEWNLAHPFFFRFIEDDKFIESFGSFILAMVICEIDGRKISRDNKVEISYIRKQLNKILREIMVGKNYG